MVLAQIAKLTVRKLRSLENVFFLGQTFYGIGELRK